MRKQEIADAEKAHAELEARTVDKIFCGEQQSESDHFMTAADSWTGSDGGVHWRRTRGRFAYELKLAGAGKIVLKGFAADRQPLTITVDGTPVGTFTLDERGQIEADLPPTAGATATVVITPETGQETPRITEVRVLRNS